jgi:hypothetical protein
VRTHANYPHNRTALRAGLELAEDTGPDDFVLVIQALHAANVERRVLDVGESRRLCTPKSGGRRIRKPNSWPSCSSSS